ncbi:Uncharacterised protein [Edwardsiella tarda]|nr:Uncharacterised protein [Edwardsiella tarda]
MAKKHSKKNLLAELQEYVANLRQTIEAECLGFDVDPAACAERRRQVADPYRL